MVHAGNDILQKLESGILSQMNPVGFEEGIWSDEGRQITDLAARTPVNLANENCGEAGKISVEPRRLPPGEWGYNDENSSRTGKTVLMYGLNKA